uniref:acid phosphatase n=1 Tax=Panagrolaimus superbus TaxID=310955 RepID=A0A914Y128_9BILA
MKAVVILLVLILKLFFCNSHPINDDDDKLVFLQAVWRHGDRSPIETYKSDPYQEDSWPQGWGQLSPKGMEQHVYLGRNRLKARYIDELKFLSPYYNSHEIYVRSTDVNRTIASAISNMFGMYGENARPGIDYPNCTGCWPIGFIPIAIHSVREDTDYVRKRS